MWLLKLLLYVVVNIVNLTQPGKRQIRKPLKGIKQYNRTERKETQTAISPPKEQYTVEDIPTIKLSVKSEEEVSLLVTPVDELSTEEIAVISQEDTNNSISDLESHELNDPITDTIDQVEDLLLMHSEETQVFAEDDVLQKNVDEVDFPGSVSQLDAIDHQQSLDGLHEEVTDEGQTIQSEMVSLSEAVVSDSSTIVEVIDANRPIFDFEGEKTDDTNIEEDDREEEIEDEFDDDDDKDEDKGILTGIAVTVHVKNDTVKKKTPRLSSIQPRNSYYSKFLDQRGVAPSLSDQDVDAFLEGLQVENLDTILGWSLPNLENHLFHALRRFDFVGDLPVSHEAFLKIVKYIRRIGRNKGKIDPKRLPPVLFLVSMVFCARYSESEARKFWDPYANLVWGLNEASLSFQQRCRKHFVNCREDLNSSLYLPFSFRSFGDVVRPVYQHAIIPSYLQEHFADWLVDNYEALIQYSSNQLSLILLNEPSLDYVPQRLRDFIQGEETSDTAARLIVQMVRAIKLYYETEQPESVESVMTSSIEKSIWQVVYKQIIRDEIRIVKLRKSTPKLEWCWNIEDEQLFLLLSNIRSSSIEKPDSITWIEKNSEYLFENVIFKKIYPWRMKSGDWEVDPIRISAEGPLNGSILVLSEEYNLNDRKEDQVKHIVFERGVPQFPTSAMFFRCNSQRNYAVQKQSIDSDGDWIIASPETLEVIDQYGNQISLHPISLVHLLRKSGFTQACRVKIELPVTVLVGEEAVIFQRTEDQLDLDLSLEGSYKVFGMTPDVPPVFSNPEVFLQFSIDPKIYPLHRTWLSIYRSGHFYQSILLSELKKQGTLTLDDKQWMVDLERFLTQPGSYSIHLLHNLKPLLNEPVQFSWLPENVRLTGPDQGTTYSPMHPLQILLQGISIEKVITLDEEKRKITEDETGIQLEWKLIKNSQCRFAIDWESTLIHFCWDIQRVSAWIEGAGDKNQVIDYQIQDVSLHVRGQPNEEFFWVIEGTGTERKHI
jgi:hypothetical protein